MFEIHSIRRRLRYMFLLSLLVLATSPPPAPMAVAAAQPSPPSASTAGAAPDVAPLGPGVASTASLPKGKSACPSAPGKRNGPGAACSDTAAAPDSSPGKVSLPKGKSQCQPANGKVSSPGAACWTDASTSKSPAAAERVSLPAGSTRCPSYGAKQSSAFAACGAQSASTQPGGLSGMKDATVMRSLDPNWSVSLYTSDSYIGVYHSITLSAYANNDVGPSPYWLSIYNASTGALLNYCGWGYSCSATYTALAITTQAFRAYVADYPSTFPPSGVAAMSGFVYTTWIAVTNLTASPQYLRPNQATTITVSANVDVGPTPYWLEIFDGSTGQIVAICASGWTCSGSVTIYGPAVHYFTGYISGYGTTNPPPSAQSSTNVYAFWMSVTISASAVALDPGGTTNLVATANADVGPSPYYISIFDTTTNTRVIDCAWGSQCSANYTLYGSSIRDFFAYVGGNGTSAPPSPVLVSSNNYVEATWMTVGLTVSPPLLSPNAPVTLNAFASMSMAGSNYYIALFDQTAQAYITECGLGSTCTTTVTQPSVTTHTFIAYVDTGYTNYPPPNIRAQSSPGTASWVTVALRACNYSRPAGCPSGSTTNGTVIGGPITFTASTQVNVQGTGYAIQITNPVGTIGASCTSGSTCTFAGATQTTPGNYTYGVQIANSSPVTPAASATAPTLKWVAAHKPWAADGSASGFGSSSQWDYSDDQSGGKFEYGIDEGLPTLSSGSQIFAPEPGTLTYEASSVWWPPGRLVLQVAGGVIIGFGHTLANPKLTLPATVAAGDLIGTVACNPGGSDCTNSHVEFMYDYTGGDSRAIANFRPPTSASNPLYATNGCPRNTYTGLSGNTVDPCAWLSAYLLYGS
jgi:hypothetical protein